MTPTVATPTLDDRQAFDHVDSVWKESIVPALVEYVKIPNKSPMFDPKWRENGHMAKAVALIEAWCRARPIAGLKVEVVAIDNRTPVIFMEIPGTKDDTVLLYGHLDKQPEMVGWSAGLGPWTPVIKDERLYGRGGADDGYAAFASLTAIEVLQRQKIPHARCVVLIEACEESGSFDLPFYVDKLATRIGTPSLIVCLDSGCGNYDQLWGTTSLRGILTGDLTVEVLSEGVHSGDASGIVPSSFRILRMILSRLEDEKTGKILPKEFHADVPPDRMEQVRAVATTLGKDVYAKFPLLPGVKTMNEDLIELVLNRTWRPALSITGAAGMPALESAGNVLRPKTSLKISFRLPPTKDAKQAEADLKRILEADPPYGAKVTFKSDGAGAGWNAPPMSPWLAKSVERASKAFFGKPAVYMGEGGSIPFMGMLGARFPKAQFLITGVLGPNSNAHGPNEFLDIPTGKKLTASVASVL
ncbi:MAG TPA: M20 family metallopeptidase, partial [Planctomycetota bacterium]|nr:M20 family metallopeptidase [Planctomycetota bacterium]